MAKGNANFCLPTFKQNARTTQAKLCQIELSMPTIGDTQETWKFSHSNDSVLAPATGTEFDAKTLKRSSWFCLLKTIETKWKSKLQNNSSIVTHRERTKKAAKKIMSNTQLQFKNATVTAMAAAARKCTGKPKTKREIVKHFVSMQISVKFIQFINEFYFHDKWSK